MELVWFLEQANLALGLLSFSSQSAFGSGVCYYLLCALVASSRKCSLSAISHKVTVKINYNGSRELDGAWHISAQIMTVIGNVALK